MTIIHRKEIQNYEQDEEPGGVSLLPEVYGGEMRRATVADLQRRRIRFTTAFYEAKQIILAGINELALPGTYEGDFKDETLIETGNYVIKVRPYCHFMARFMYPQKFNLEHKTAFRGIKIRWGYDPRRKVLVIRHAELLPWE